MAEYRDKKYEFVCPTCNRVAAEIRKNIHGKTVYVHFIRQKHGSDNATLGGIIIPKRIECEAKEK